MIKTVGVIGASRMGNAIAHLFALHGHKVILCDISDCHLNASLAKICSIAGGKDLTNV